ALMLAPRILLIDEPSVGLAPVLVSRTIDKIKELKDQYKLTVLMAEQNFPQALRIADRGYVIVHGQIAFEGRSADELNNTELIGKFYLGLESRRASRLRPTCALTCPPSGIPDSGGRPEDEGRTTARIYFAFS